MEDAMKSNSCGASTDGTAAVDVDGILFLTKQLGDVDAVKTMNYGSSFALEISCCGQRWVGGRGMKMWMEMECGME